MRDKGAQIRSLGWQQPPAGNRSIRSQGRFRPGEHVIEIDLHAEVIGRLEHRPQAQLRRLLRFLGESLNGVADCFARRLPGGHQCRFTHSLGSRLHGLLLRGERGLAGNPRRALRKTRLARHLPWRQHMRRRARAQLLHSLLRCRSPGTLGPGRELRRPLRDKIRIRHCARLQLLGDLRDETAHAGHALQDLTEHRHGEIPRQVFRRPRRHLFGENLRRTILRDRAGVHRLFQVVGERGLPNEGFRACRAEGPAERKAAHRRECLRRCVGNAPAVLKLAALRQFLDLRHAALGLGIGDAGPLGGRLPDVLAGLAKHAAGRCSPARDRFIERLCALLERLHGGVGLVFGEAQLVEAAACGRHTGSRLVFDKAEGSERISGHATSPPRRRRPSPPRDWPAE